MGIRVMITIAIHLNTRIPGCRHRKARLGERRTEREGPA